MMANGWTSREKSKLAVKRVHHVPKNEETAMVPGAANHSDEDLSDSKSLVVAIPPNMTAAPKRSTLRFGMFVYSILHVLIDILKNNVDMISISQFNFDITSDRVSTLWIFNHVIDNRSQERRIHSNICKVSKNS